jgi:hypothetical protein
MKPVSTPTEMALRAALARLAERRAALTDGRLTVANLAREAGVSRAAANRAPVVLAEMRDLAEARKDPPRVADRIPLEEARKRRDADHLHAQHLQVRALLGWADSRRQIAATANIHPLRRDD